MPDSNLSPMQAMQQSEMLREIRDELRMSRMSGGGAPGTAAGSSMGAAKPGSTFVQAQIAADRALVGDWGSLGWSQAYKTQHNTSLLNDALAMSGLVRAPNTMFQSEYQDYATQAFGARLATLPGRLIAGGFMNRADQLGASVAAASPRFMRYGDAGAGALGYGMGPQGAQRFGREMQAGASRDMLLSGKDYNSVFDAGAGSGQFDFARSTGDLSKTFAELRTATADLTRSMRMSVDEVGQTLGALRQYGIKDVGEQYRVAQQISGNARIAGMSSQEMMSSVQRALSGGLSAGVVGGGVAGLGSNAAADIRSMSRDGLISTAVAAAGGGSTNIANSIVQSQLGFAGSNMGYYAARGGLGTDFFGSLTRGVSGASTMSGMLSAEAGRLDFLSKRSSGQLGRGFNNYIDSQITAMGMNSESEDGQNMAMQLAMSSGMDSAAALTYGRSRGTAGRYSSARNRYLSHAQADDMAGQGFLDQQYLNESMTGRMRQTTAAIGGGIADAINGVSDAFSPGAGGFLGLGGSIASTRRGLASGALRDSVTMEQAAVASRGSRGPVSSGVGSQVYDSGFGGAGGTVAGSAVGLGIAALVTNPIGWGVLGSAALVGGGGLVGSLANAGSHTVGDASSLLRANAALNDPGRYAASARIALTTGTSATSGALLKNPLFQTLVSAANMGSLSPSQTDSLVATAKTIASQSGVSLETVMAALPQAGVSVSLAKTHMHVEGASANSDALLDRVVGGNFIGYGGLSEAGGVLAKASGQGAVADLARAISSGDGRSLAQARVALSGLGINGKDMERLVTNIRGLSSIDRSALVSGIDANSTSMRNVAAYRAYSPTVSMLGDTADDLSADDATRNRLRGALGGYKKDPLSLIHDVATGELSSDTRTLLTNTEGLDKALKVSGFHGGSAEIVKEFFDGHANMKSVADSIIQKASTMPKGAGGQQGNVKELLAAYLLNPGGYQNPEEAAATESRKSAHLLSEAAIAMREVCNRLGITGNEK